jgi:carbonic anhydrase
MNRKLFLICPDARVEHFLRTKFGGESIFLTALGAVFNFRAIQYIEDLSDYLHRERIEEIFIVNDLSCRFIDRILRKERNFGTYTEEVLQDLLIDHYHAIMQQPTLKDQHERLAAYNIDRQAREILSNELLQQQIVASDILIKGLITNQKENRLTEIHLDIHEYCS